MAAAGRIKVRWKPKRDALLLIDVINDLEFSRGDDLLPWAERMVRPLRAIRAAAHRERVPVIYANDNFGLWRGGRDEVLAHCTRGSARGRDVSRRLRPTAQDYFLLKPRHSAFFGSPLQTLLESLEVKRLMLAGLATNLCVLATAHDAIMHGYELVVLSDCCAAETDFDHDVVLSQLQRFFRARICRSDEVG